MKKVKIRKRVNAYAVISDAVERGAAYGWHRAFKHTTKPDDAVAIAAIESAVLSELCEVLDFDK